MGTDVWKSSRQGIGRGPQLLSFEPHVVEAQCYRLWHQFAAGILHSSGDGRGRSLHPSHWVSEQEPSPCSDPWIPFLLHVFTTMWQMCSEICRVSNVTGLPWDTMAESKWARSEGWGILGNSRESNTRCIFLFLSNPKIAQLCCMDLFLVWIYEIDDMVWGHQSGEKEEVSK